MIKRSIYAVVLLLVVSNFQLKACDACGCSASALGIGPMTNFKNNFVRLAYFNTRFTTNPSHELISVDQFHRAQLTLRYSFDQLARLKISGHLPYGFNQRSNEVENLTHDGIGDIRLLAHYAIVDNYRMQNNSSIYVELGGGVSLPTGNFDPHIHDRDMPENFNVGIGAVGYQFQQNTVFNFNNSGILLNSGLLINSSSPNGYKFGNQFSSSLALFHEIGFSTFSVNSFAELRYEYITADVYKSGTNVPATSGSGVFVAPTVNIKTPGFITGITYSIPVQDHYSQGEVIAGQRLTCHFSILF